MLTSNTESSMTYLYPLQTKIVGNIRITFYRHPQLGICHVAYETI